VESKIRRIVLTPLERRWPSQSHGCRSNQGTLNPTHLEASSVILEFQNPIPVVTPIGEGYAIYTRDGGTFENDIWAVVVEDGSIFHFRTDQLKIHANATFDIKKK